MLGDILEHIAPNPLRARRTLTTALHRPATAWLSHLTILPEDRAHSTTNPNEPSLLETTSRFATEIDIRSTRLLNKTRQRPDHHGHMTEKHDPKGIDMATSRKKRSTVKASSIQI